MTKTLVEEYVEHPDHMRVYQQERAILEVTDLLEARMKELGVTRGDLAKRLRKSKGWVTQLLDGENNKTIRTIADAFAVLGDEYHSRSNPIQISNESSPAMSFQKVTPLPSGKRKVVVFYVCPESLESSAPSPVQIQNPFGHQPLQDDPFQARMSGFNPSLPRLAYHG